VTRHLVLFAREPRREAREKGLGGPGAELFAQIAAGWCEAAQRCVARLVIATPPEDIRAWRRSLPSESIVRFLPQSGGSFGERLADVARRSARLPGSAVLVGGDVLPSTEALREAFEALERGADAVLAPARDGGVSLIGVAGRDADLLIRLAPRDRGVATALRDRLAQRGRSIALVTCAPDVDGRRSLAALLSSLPAGALRSLARAALRTGPGRPSEASRAATVEPRGIPSFRAPPPAA